MPPRRRRKSLRRKGYDYTQAGAYFITICAHQRRHLFSRIVNHKVVLTPYGRVLNSKWRAIPRHFRRVKLDAFVIMPDHFHALLFLEGRPSKGRRNSSSSLGEASPSDQRIIRPEEEAHASLQGLHHPSSSKGEAFSSKQRIIRPHGDDHDLWIPQGRMDASPQGIPQGRMDASPQGRHHPSSSKGEASPSDQRIIRPHGDDHDLWIPQGRMDASPQTMEEYLAGLDALLNNRKSAHKPPNPNGTKHGSLGAIVQNFKSTCSRSINKKRKSPGARVWQRDYFERILYCKKYIVNVRLYIRKNPRKWKGKHYSS